MEKEIDKSGDNTLAARLNELMASNHWSRSDMAKIADVSPTSVTNWFKRQTISKESASRLAQAARVSLAWILTGENEAGAGLSEDEEALIRVFRELPPIEQRNMLAAFQMRIQFLREYYANNADPVTRNK
ncbi:helix-turn-helix domain-containing protein [Salmonella enterica]|nr:helix-turn-helix domain-containing protein [Salmonella enterica]EHO4927629.1 helix-turn-helix domain-containing protein [Salmonella enterica subsp. enterica serovar Corvallis]EHS6172719.1 helix-turn-helix domain-containing protein [Salmonella enterica]EHT3857925.1 helix-turn-helix domain-containing protein [Salmonella enterica]ELS5068204.1 helix-turn-helix domain-containing protein [Salmonella enterica]